MLKWLNPPFFFSVFLLNLENNNFNSRINISFRIGGAAATILKGRGALQDIDQMSLFKPLCKYCATVTSVRDIGPILRTALQIAQSDTPGTSYTSFKSARIIYNFSINLFYPGPVFVEFPIDVLYSYDLVKREVGAKPEGRGIVNKITNW